MFSLENIVTFKKAISIDYYLYISTYTIQVIFEYYTSKLYGVNFLIQNVHTAKPNDKYGIQISYNIRKILANVDFWLF